jgi:hypothetical protein
VKRNGLPSKSFLGSFFQKRTASFPKLRPSNSVTPDSGPSTYPLRVKCGMKEKKSFFFEKKNQKTFVLGRKLRSELQPAGSRHP